MSTRTSAQLGALLAAAAVAAGCGGSSQQSTTAGAASHTQSQPQTSVSGQATTNVAHARGQRHAKAGLAVASRPAIVSGVPVRSAGRRAAVAQASTPKPPAIPAGPLVSGFSGAGNQAIGSISEKKSVVIEWNAASPPIQIFNAHGVLLLNSDLPSGRVRLASGDYRNLHVGSKGPWRIQIHASA